MRLLTSTDFALRVLMRLSATPDTHVSTDTLARELVISRHHLHKIVQYLTEAGLVRTIRGAHGGVMLARPASEIKVGEVIRSHEHDQALVECFRADGGACTVAAALPPARHARRRQECVLPASRSLYAGGLPRRARAIRARATRSKTTTPLRTFSAKEAHWMNGGDT